MSDPDPGTTLRTWRERAGMSQGDLGDALGVAGSEIERWESGEERPGPGVVERIAGVLHIPAGALRAIAGEAAPVEIPIRLVGPEEIAERGGKGRLAGLRSPAAAARDRVAGWGRDLRADRARFNMVLGLAVAVLFFVLAAVGFSRASNAEEEAEALRDDVAAAESVSDELRAEGEALRDRADGLEDEVAAAGRRAAEAEEAARLQWEPLIAENERLAAENRFLRKAVVVSSAAGDVARVGLTFDGDPTPGALASTLDTLAAAGVQATFFPSGSAMEANPDGWVRAVAEGHELGNATYDRVPIDRADPEAALESIKGWERAARLVAGSDYRATWFRPPLLGGFEDRVGTREVRNLIARRGLITALWSVETYYALFASGGPQEAGPDPDASDVAAYVTGEAGGGSIILLQFGSLDIDAVPDILVGLRGKGLEPGTLTQLFDAQERMYDGDLASPDGA